MALVPYKKAAIPLIAGVPFSEAIGIDDILREEENMRQWSTNPKEYLAGRSSARRKIADMMNEEYRKREAEYEPKLGPIGAKRAAATAARAVGAAALHAADEMYPVRRRKPAKRKRKPVQKRKRAANKKKPKK